MAANANDLSALEALNRRDIDLNDYTFAQERFDERFGLIFFMKSKNSTKTILVKERSKNLTQQQFQELSSRLKIYDDYLLEVYGVKQVPNSSNFQIYFEDFTTDLQAEIKRHLTEKTRFSEGELYAMLYGGVSALACLEKHSLAHEFIVPLNLLKLSKDVYKLHDNFTISNKSYLYNHALRGQYRRYLAPELLQSLTNKKEKPDDYDAQKADIFALGMCILDAGLLDTEGDYINKKLMVLDERALIKALNRFGDLYSDAMKQILEDMLFPDPSKRPCASLLLKRLPGKPMVLGAGQSAKKRKVLDQIISSGSPEKVDNIRVRSPERRNFPMESSPARSNNPNRLLYIEKSPPYEPRALSPERSYVPTRPLYESTPSYVTDSYLPSSTYKAPQSYSSYPETRVADLPQTYLPSATYETVSPSIRNDPILSKYVRKVTAEPAPSYDVRVSPSRNTASQRLISSQVIRTNDIPITTSQPLRTSYSPVRYTSTHVPDFHQPVGTSTYIPRTEPTTYYQTPPPVTSTTSYYHSDIREPDVKRFVTVDPLAPTQKISYPSTYVTQVSPTRPSLAHNFTSSVDVLRPKEDLVSTRSYHLDAIPRTTETRVLTQTSPPAVNYEVARTSYLPAGHTTVTATTTGGALDSRSTAGNLNDMINKALERSSKTQNTYQPSSGLGQTGPQSYLL